MRHDLVVLALALLLSAGAVAADDPVFSGPQPGERLPPFTFQGVYGDDAGKPRDVVSQTDGKPVVLIFVHETTRPSIGLTRAVMTYAGSRAQDGLHAAVVFLTNDPTATEQWMRIPSVREQALPQGVQLGIYKEGQEGPGAYGLNRNVALTVLIGKEGKVTANFALVQPSIQADAPKILQAIVAAVGGEVPNLASLGVGREMPARAADRAMAAVEAKLRELVGPLLQAKTTDEATRAAARVEAYAAEHADFAKELGARMQRVAASPKFAEYGQTPEAREHIQKWAEKFGPPRNEP